MKNIFLNHIEFLKNNHFFLLLAIITTFINAIIQIFIFTLFQIIITKSKFGYPWMGILTTILICLSPFILIWIISFIATLFSQKLKLIVSIITFFINFFIILFQSIVGYFFIIFMLIF